MPWTKGLSTPLNGSMQTHWDSGIHTNIYIRKHSTGKYPKWQFSFEPKMGNEFSRSVIIIYYILAQKWLISFLMWRSTSTTTHTLSIELVSPCRQGRILLLMYECVCVCIYMCASMPSSNNIDRDEGQSCGKGANKWQANWLATFALLAHNESEY